MSEALVQMAALSHHSSNDGCEWGLHIPKRAPNSFRKQIDNQMSLIEWGEVDDEDPVPRHMQGTDAICWAGIRSYSTRIADKGFDLSVTAHLLSLCL